MSKTWEEEKRCCSICDAKKVCHVCGTQTLYACSDCQINLNATVYVCGKNECRDTHEQNLCSARTSPKMLEPINARELLSLSAEYGERSKFLEAILERFGTGKMGINKAELDVELYQALKWYEDYAGLKFSKEIDVKGLAQNLSDAIHKKFSRPDVVVKVPEKKDTTDDRGHTYNEGKRAGHNEAIDLCTQALEKQGIKVDYSLTN